MTLLKDNNYKEINVALLSLEADIKKLSNNGSFDTSVIDKQLAEINSRIDKINAGNNNSSAEINDIRTEIENINSKLIGNSVRIENIEQNIGDIGTQIDGIEQNIGDIDTRIGGIEQKLSDIFSAENKVTDFNATTNSGIYYWLDDATNRPTDYGVLLVNKYDRGDNNSIWINQIAYGTNNKIYFRQNINNGNWTEWKAVAFEGEVNDTTTTKTFSLSSVTTNTTKYIKLGTFYWNDSFSFRCRIGGNSFQDNVNINILSGNSRGSSVCGYYSTNSSLTKSIIVKRGDAWNSNFEIYLKIAQLTTADVNVTVDKDVQDRINISESTTAPSGTLEEIVFSNINGMFSGSVEAKNLVLDSVNGISSGYGLAPLTIGFPSGTGDGKSLVFDRNSMQARTNGATSELYLNYYGGNVQIGAGNATGSKLTIQGLCVSSNSYTDANPKLVFKNDNGGQNISLTFTDFDAVQAPASLTLNGNQGNEYFIAPCIKANNKMRIPIGAPSSLEDGCIWIER